MIRRPDTASGSPPPQGKTGSLPIPRHPTFPPQPKEKSLQNSLGPEARMGGACAPQGVSAVGSVRQDQVGFVCLCGLFLFCFVFLFCFLFLNNHQ